MKDISDTVARLAHNVLYSFDKYASDIPHMSEQFEESSKEYRDFMTRCARLSVERRLIPTAMEDELREYALLSGWKPGPVTCPTRKETPMAAHRGLYTWSEQERARFWVLHWSFIAAADTQTKKENNQ